MTSTWISGERNGQVKAVRLPLIIYNALMDAKKTLSIQSIAKKLNGGSCTTIDDGLEYEVINPIELAVLKNKLAKSEKDKKKLSDNCDKLLDKLESFINVPPYVSELEKLQSIIDNQELKIDELSISNKELAEFNLELQSSLDEEQADSKQTIEALRFDIKKLESKLVNLQSKQVEQKPKYENVINEFQQRALEASATSPRHDQLRQLLKLIGFSSWEKQGKKGWFWSD
ncbi:MAG: hypothetical protein IMF12_00095 [Proteobacteria bacterium]|nr:hypothetical protein [Pseudomonadota bacterium]